MHSGTKLWPTLGWTSALALAAACGNYSNDDIIFTEAVPVVGTVQVVLPVSTAQPLCGIGVADLYNSAQQTASDLNNGIDTILGWADVIRTFPPSERSTDHRGWGPWPDQSHPGLETKVAMDRTAPDSFDFTLYERRLGQPDWPALLTAHFQGGRPEHGSGYLIIHFDVSRALNIGKPDDPPGDMIVSYDFSNHQHIALNLGGAGLGVPSGAYSFDRYAEGNGKFSFAFADGMGNRFVVDATFQASGAGIAVAKLEVDAGQADYTECWDSAACISYLYDFYDLTQKVCGAGVSPCERGDASACPGM